MRKRNTPEKHYAKCKLAPWECITCSMVEDVLDALGMKLRY